MGKAGSGLMDGRTTEVWSSRDEIETARELVAGMLLFVIDQKREAMVLLLFVFSLGDRAVREPEGSHER
jgi:hypothetical protein